MCYPISFISRYYHTSQKSSVLLTSISRWGERFTLKYSFVQQDVVWPSHTLRHFPYNLPHCIFSCFVFLATNSMWNARIEVIHAGTRWKPTIIQILAAVELEPLATEFSRFYRNNIKLSIKNILEVNTWVHSISLISHQKCENLNLSY